jgi:NTE family protein
VSTGSEDTASAPSGEPTDAVPATKEDLKIGLALSGGGMRAAVFHLGVLDRLAAEGLLESVVFVSTVSGGSLGTGLVYALSGNRWPSSEAYSQTVLPEARRLITTVDIQRAALTALLRRPWRLISPGRWANVLSEVLQRRLGIQGVVKNLPVTPRWIVNATSYETGKNWRFTRHRMGDYEFGYVSDPPVLIADAIAASAGYPLLIGFLSLDTADYSWWRFEEGSTSVTRLHNPEHRRVHLWDGGVYDNLGVEALFKVGKGLRQGYNFLVVSDASTALDIGKRYVIVQQARRLLSVAMDQVRSLRTRTIFDHFGRDPGSGVYLLMAKTVREALSEGRVPEDVIERVVPGCMPDEEARVAAKFSTTLRKISEHEFDLIYRHGWEVADCNLRAHRPDLFAEVPRQQRP